MAATAQKAYIGMGMEGSIARWYEKTTRRDLPEFRKLAERLNALLPNGGDMLEVAPGPGFLAIELAQGGKFHVTGLDISRTFVAIAGKNAAEAECARSSGRATRRRCHLPITVSICSCAAPRLRIFPSRKRLCGRCTAYCVRAALA